MLITIEQIQQDIQDLPEEAQILLIDFIEILKKRYPKPTPKNQSQEKSLYEKFAEIGLIGCVSTEENLSTTYKQILSELEFRLSSAKRPSSAELIKDLLK